MADYIDSITIDNGAKREIVSIGPESTYAGADLTTKFASEIAASPYNGNAWAWIKARIQAGNFIGIHIWDYIPFTANGNSVKARVAGINTYKNFGDTAIPNHIDFISEGVWPTTKAINPVNWNNGLIPIETITSDGSSTEYTLTKPMHGIQTVKLSDTEITDFTYNNVSHKLTFVSAPAAGTLTVTGTGSEYPWLACDLYLWLNSLAGHVVADTTNPPGTAISQVDYTEGGVYYHLPQNLKNVIVEKRFYLEKRYNATSKLSSSNSGGWTNIGKLWLPTELEVYGTDCWGGKGYPTMFSQQYPIFAHNNARLKGRRYWWLLAPDGSSTTNWCSVNYYGNANYTNTSNADRVPICFRIA